MGNKLSRDEGRRQFLKRAPIFAVAIPSLVTLNSSCHAQKNQSASRGIVGGGCDGCEGIYEGMPQQLSWQTAIASAAEPGERLEISGIIYQVDGKRPAPNVILYAYHTDATGHYSPAPDATNNARRHGHLRGWLKTNASGEYKFTTIKPAPYPNTDNPAHIHPIVKEADKNEYYIDEYVFDDDPLLTQEKRSKLENRGGSGIVRLTKSADGLWTGTRNIILGLNIPNYR
jgi:protocatechuate 3,4-dioxygenase beta subunit